MSCAHWGLGRIPIMHLTIGFYFGFYRHARVPIKRGKAAGRRLPMRFTRPWIEDGMSPAGVARRPVQEEHPDLGEVRHWRLSRRVSGRSQGQAPTRTRALNLVQNERFGRGGGAHSQATNSLYDAP